MQRISNADKPIAMLMKCWYDIQADWIANGRYYILPDSAEARTRRFLDQKKADLKDEQLALHIVHEVEEELKASEESSKADAQAEELNTEEAWDAYRALSKEEERIRAKYICQIGQSTGPPMTQPRRITSTSQMRSTTSVNGVCASLMQPNTLRSLQ